MSKEPAGTKSREYEVVSILGPRILQGIASYYDGNWFVRSGPIAGTPIVLYRDTEGNWNPTGCNDVFTADAIRVTRRGAA